MMSQFAVEIDHLAGARAKAVVFDDSPEAPFVERLTGILALLFANSFTRKMAQLPMRSTVWSDTKAHWSPEALEKRAANRKLYMDTKFPETKLILIGD